MYQLKALSYKELLIAIERTSDKEHEATLEFLIYLIEVEDRRLYAEEGYSSMFSFCTQRLRYSEGAAHRRIQGARALRDFPLTRQLLERKEINLCTLSVVFGSLTEENSSELLRAICNKSRREVEALASSFKPRASSPKEVIKPISVFVPEKPEVSGAPFDSSSEDTFASERDPNPLKSQKLETKFKLSFTASEETMALLSRARGFMEFKDAGSLEKTFEVLLKSYLGQKDPVQKAKRRAARSKRKAKAPVKAKKVTRHIPAKTKEEVFVHDRGRCQYVSPTGHQCTETRNLQYDHIRPFASGGGHEADNLRMYCSLHNRHAAEKLFGRRYRVAGKEGGVVKEVDCVYETPREAALL